MNGGIRWLHRVYSVFLGVFLGDFQVSECFATHYVNAYFIPNVWNLGTSVPNMRQ
jgi:hypothetical protein